MKVYVINLIQSTPWSYTYVDTLKDYLRELDSPDIICVPRCPQTEYDNLSRAISRGLRLTGWRPPELKFEDWFPVIYARSPKMLDPQYTMSMEKSLRFITAQVDTLTLCVGAIDDTPKKRLLVKQSLNTLTQYDVLTGDFGFTYYDDQGFLIEDRMIDVWIDYGRETDQYTINSIQNPRFHSYCDFVDRPDRMYISHDCSQRFTDFHLVKQNPVSHHFTMCLTLD